MRSAADGGGAGGGGDGDDDDDDDARCSVPRFMSLVVSVVPQIGAMYFAYDHAQFSTTHPAETQFWSSMYWVLSFFYNVNLVITLACMSTALAYWTSRDCLALRARKCDCVSDDAYARVTVIEITNRAVGVCLDVVFLIITTVELTASNHIVGLYPQSSLAWFLLCVAARLFATTFAWKCVDYSAPTSRKKW